MDFKQESERLLELLRIEGVDRRKIEKDLGYSENYIDQVLSKGSNKKFVTTLSTYYNNKKFEPPKEITPDDRAIIQVLLLEVAKLKSKIYGTPVDDVIDELNQNTILARKQMKN